MRQHRPTNEPSPWPPDLYTGTDDYLVQTIWHASTSTPQMDSSSISSVHPTELSHLNPPPASWMRKHGKVFHDTPTLENLGREQRPEADTLCVSAPVDRPRPLIVKQGANCQAADDGPIVSVDWLRFSGPRQQRQKALCLLESFFGDSKPGKGRFWLNSGYHFASGGLFFDDCEQAKSHFTVELPSSLLAELDDPAQVQQLARELYTMGCKCIRADIAVDFFDQPNLIDLALESCENDQLTGSKTFMLTYGKSSRKSTGRTLNIGKRGKEGSGRFLRIYDKGLETKTKQPGEWIRWEAELSDDCSNQFIADYIDQTDDRGSCIAHAMGVCDFREEPHKRLSRRPRCEWFQTLLGAVTPVTVKARRKSSNIYSKVRWFQTCVAPALRTIQHVTGHTLDQVVTQITGTVRPKQSKLQDVFIREVCASLGVSPHELHYQFTRGGTVHA